MEGVAKVETPLKSLITIKSFLRDFTEFKRLKAKSSCI